MNNEALCPPIQNRRCAFCREEIGAAILLAPIRRTEIHKSNYICMCCIQMLFHYVEHLTYDYLWQHHVNFPSEEVYEFDNKRRNG